MASAQAPFAKMIEKNKYNTNSEQTQIKTRTNHSPNTVEFQTKATPKQMQSRTKSRLVPKTTNKTKHEPLCHKAKLPGGKKHRKHQNQIFCLEEPRKKQLKKKKKKKKKTMLPTGKTMVALVLLLMKFFFFFFSEAPRGSGGARETSSFEHLEGIGVVYPLSIALKFCWLDF